MPPVLPRPGEDPIPPARCARLDRGTSPRGCFRGVPWESSSWHRIAVRGTVGRCVKSVCLLHGIARFHLDLGPGRLEAEHLPGRSANVPDQTDSPEEAEHVVTDVDLPPEEPLVGGTLEVMVVVVPALAQREQRQQEVVAALVA